MGSLSTTIYYCVSKNHRIDASSIKHEQKDKDGQIIQHAQIITFRDHFYATDSKKEKDLIQSASFFAQGKIKIVSEEEMGKIQQKLAAKRIVPVPQRPPEVSPVPDTTGLGYNPHITADDALGNDLSPEELAQAAR